MNDQQVRVGSNEKIHEIVFRTEQYRKCGEQQRWKRRKMKKKKKKKKNELS